MHSPEYRAQFNVWQFIFFVHSGVFILSNAYLLFVIPAKICSNSGCSLWRATSRFVFYVQHLTRCFITWNLSTTWAEGINSSTKLLYGSHKSMLTSSICSNTYPVRVSVIFLVSVLQELQLTLICLSQLVLHSNYLCLWSAISSSPNRFKGLV